MKIVGKIEKQRVKMAKVQCDIKFILHCKKENLFPTFTKPKFPIKVKNYLRNKISHQILETELKNQHIKRKKLIRQLKGNITNINNNMEFVCKIVLYSKVKNIISKGKIKWDNTHNNKLEKLYSEKRYIEKPKYRVVKNIVHNFSSHTLTSEEEYALSFNLDQHIPTKNNVNKIKTEFESFFYDIQKHTKDIDQHLQDELKTKIRTCENFSKLKIPYKQQNIINHLSRNKDVIVMRQDKGRGVTILDRKDYIYKCMGILNTSQFRKLDIDPTKSLERKVQRILRKIKNNLNEDEYKKLYPTGSRPGLFYGTPKVHKLKQQEGLDKLTMISFISNIETATYETAKYHY